MKLACQRMLYACLYFVDRMSGGNVAGCPCTEGSSESRSLTSCSCCAAYWSHKPIWFVATFCSASCWSVIIPGPVAGLSLMRIERMELMLGEVTRLKFV